MWAQKASAAGITAGIGIVAGKDAAGNPISQVAIAASQLFVFDPNNPGNTAYPFAVSGGKVVIQKAVIYDAVVQTLAAQRIVADEVIRKGPYYSRSRSALSPEETLSARFVRSMQDKFQVLKAV